MLELSIQGDSSSTKGDRKEGWEEEAYKEQAREGILSPCERCVCFRLARRESSLTIESTRRSRAIQLANRWYMHKLYTYISLCCCTSSEITVEEGVAKSVDDDNKIILAVIIDSWSLLGSSDVHKEIYARI